MQQIKCSCCDKHLIEVPDTDGPGTIAAKLIQAGFIAKNTILFTSKNHWVQFCGTSCKKAFYDLLDIPPGRTEEVAAWARKVREEIPVLASKIANGVSKLQELLLAMKK